MRRPALSLLNVVLLALLLLGAQQGAFAHMIGHAGASAVTVAGGGDEGHGEALTLSHVCTTCVGLSALAAAPPPVLPMVVAAAVGHALPAWRGSTAAAAPQPGYRARGPPAVF